MVDLNIAKNEFESIDISKNPALERISCENNQLQFLDVSNNTVLKYLCCYDNELESLDLGNNIELSQLYCNGNEIEMKDDTLRRVVRGETTVSRIIAGRLNRKKIAYEYAQRRNTIKRISDFEGEDDA